MKETTQGAYSLLTSARLKYPDWDSPTILTFKVDKLPPFSRECWQGGLRPGWKVSSPAHSAFSPRFPHQESGGGVISLGLGCRGVFHIVQSSMDKDMSISYLTTRFPPLLVPHQPGAAQSSTGSVWMGLQWFVEPPPIHGDDILPVICYIPWGELLEGFGNVLHGSGG